MAKRLELFLIDGVQARVMYKETQTVKDGVECDIYDFVDDATRDLAIVRVACDARTPKQRILQGDVTVEGYIDGEGTLEVISDGDTRKYDFTPEQSGEAVRLHVGDIMQWHASGDAELTFYEICAPPYEDGRFEDITDDIIEK